MTLITRRVFTTVIAASGLLAALPLRAATKPVIRFAVADRAAPIAYRRDDGVVSGVEVDVATLVGSVAGWQLEIMAYPWSRAQALVRQDSADALCTVATDDRRSYILFAPKPLFSINSGFLHFSPRNPRRAEILRIKSLDDLRAFRIAGSLGDSWPNGLFAGWPNFQETPDIGISMKLVATDRADLVFGAREIISFFLNQHKMEPLEVGDASFLPGSISIYHFGLRRTLDGVEALIADFARAQEKAEASGAIAKIVKSYLS